MPRRHDATLVKNISKFQEFTFHIMPKKTNSNALCNMIIDLEETYAFLDKINKNREFEITLFEIALLALARAVTVKSRANRFIAGRRLWQRNEVSISFVVKREKVVDGKEVNATIRFSPYDTLETVSKKMKHYIEEARHGENPNDKDIELFGKLPRIFLRLIAAMMRVTEKLNMPIKRVTKDLPFYSTIFLANLGSLGLPGAFHHLFELGTTSFFIVLGKVHLASVIDQKTGAPSVKRVIDMSINFDERMADGVYYGPVLDYIRDFLEHPAQLMEPVEVTEELLQKLMLKDYPPKNKRKKQRKKKK